MKKTILYVALGIFACACQKEKELVLDIKGLEDLGSTAAYEGWIIVDDKPVSTGVFTVGSDGAVNKSFDVDRKDLKDATAFVLTIEPSPDDDPAPSDIHILAGDFGDDDAQLTVDHGSALGTSFSTATGNYILATPTDADNTNETSGVWWLDPNAGPGAGLDLPTLPAGWKYEGWVVVNGTPVSTGTFLSASVADDAAPYSGSTSGPAFPGEDLLMNAPSGLTFPTDLSSQKVVISVEPSPDNSTAPFLLKPLVGNVPSAAATGTLYTMDNNASATNPSGTVTR
ncbi:MAG: anti-sigma factor [Flavobacteriales bacterium]|nr:anti-sigma factor [Flavobacteriales bacterium]